MQRAAIKADDVAGLAMFDTMTLNTDRHAGNVLMGKDGSLIPIDHGASFVQDEMNGPGEALARISENMGSAANALFALPSAHEPMSSGMRKKLSAIDPDAFAASLTQDRDTIANQHNGMANMIDNDAITRSKRAARVVRIAAKRKPPVSLAVVQQVVGTYAEELFGCADNQLAAKVATWLDREAGYQKGSAAVGLSQGSEYGMLCKKVAALGWAVQLRNEPPKTGAIANPAQMLMIVTHSIYRQGAGQPNSATADQLKTLAPGAADLMDGWARVQEATITALADAVAPGDKQRVLKMLAGVKSGGDRRSRELRRIVVVATDLAMRCQTGRWERAQNAGLPAAVITFAGKTVDWAIEVGDPVTLCEKLDELASANNIVLN